MFTTEERDRVREHVLRMASADSRVVGAAVVGSLARGEVDRWSDLDLTFAVADDAELSEVLDEWSETVLRELSGVHLFDLPSGPSIYRVFLLPGCLELDLSFTPASSFGPTGPAFRLLFGRVVDRRLAPTRAEELFGYAVHHAIHARACIERGRAWQAEYWISAIRDHALALACRRRGLDGTYGRDFDRLPAEVANSHEGALVRGLDGDELRRALTSAVAGLLRESVEVEAMARLLEAPLREAASLAEAADGGAVDGA